MALLEPMFWYSKRFIGLHLIQHPAQRAHTKQYYWYLVRCNELDVGLSLVQYVFNILKKMPRCLKIQIWHKTISRYYQQK